MLRFAAELKQPAVLYGMREGYRAADRAEERQRAGAGQPEVAGGSSRSRIRMSEDTYADSGGSRARLRRLRRF